MIYDIVLVGSIRGYFTRHMVGWVMGWRNGGWGQGVSSIGSLIRSGRIPYGGGVLELGGASPGGGVGHP